MSYEKFRRQYKKRNPKYDWDAKCGNDLLRLYYPDEEWKPGSVLLCPNCGGPYLHKKRVNQRGLKDAEITMTFECEYCDVVSRLELGNQKGYFFFKWVKTMEKKTRHLGSGDPNYNPDGGGYFRPGVEFVR